MSLTAAISPRTMALSGNPVKLEITSSSPVNYVIRNQSNVIFEGSGETGNFFVFIDEFLSAILSPTHYTGEETDIILSTSSNLKEYTIEVNNQTGDRQTLQHKVLLGGISKRAMRHLNQTGSNIFTMKLLNAAGNFFMSTRTEQRVLSIRETEIRPLLFIAPVTTFTVKVAEGISTVISGLTVGACYALNLEALRKYFFSKNNMLASQFEIITVEGKAVTIVISPANIEKERYYIEFLNSYGAYECIEVTGKPTLDQDKGEDEVYGKYDEEVNDYTESRERVNTVDNLHVQTGFKTEKELMFILDMLSSDEIYLIGYGNRGIKVNASADSLAIAKNMNTPQSLPITLRFCDSEKHFTQELNSNDFNNPRIHTDVFSKQFN